MCVLLMCMHISGTVVAQEQLLSRPVSLKGQNLSVAEYLQILQNEQEIVISYTSSQIDDARRLNVDVKNMPLEQVIKHVLSTDRLVIKQRRNHIILTLLPKPPETGWELEKNKISETPPEVRYVYKTDTVRLVEYLNDTIVVRDTVTKVETQIKIQVDTVLIDPFINDVEHPWSLDIQYMNFRPFYSYEGDQAMVNATKALESAFFHNYGLSVGISFQKNKIRYSGALAFLQTGNRYAYNETVVEGGYYNVDTTDSYYTISDNDTTWYHVTDSSWVELRENNFSTEGKTRITWLSLPFKLGYCFNYKKFRYVIQGGMSVLVGLGEKGKVVNPNEVTQVKDLNSDILLSTNVRLSGGVEIKYQLHEMIDASIGFEYGRWMKSFYVDSYPLVKRPDDLGVSMGLSFKL